MPKRRFGYNDWERVINKGNGSNLISFNTQDHIEKKIKGDKKGEEAFECLMIWFENSLLCGKYDQRWSLLDEIKRIYNKK